MKITVSLVLYAVILLAAASVPMSAENLFAMGSKKGFYELQDSGKNKGKLNNGTGKVEDREEKRSPEEGDEKSGNSPSRKKPRLKYRDLYECGC